MPSKPLSCRLSKLAQNDLENIFDYAAQEYGADQALIYVKGIKFMFKELEQNPKLGRIRNEFSTSLSIRSLTKEQHIIFYKIEDGHIWIIRVLHSSRDIFRHLSVDE